MRRSASSRIDGKADFRPSIDSVHQLKNRETRDAQGLYFVEGFRFAHAAIRSAAPIVSVGWCPELAKSHAVRQVSEHLARHPQFRLSPGEIAGLGFSPEPQGIVLVLRQERLSLGDATPLRVGAWIGIESMRTPGNLGTILRSMVAAGSPGLLLFGNRGAYADLYDPPVIRASMGAHFNLPAIYTTYKEFGRWSYRSEFRVVGADATGNLDYRKVGYMRPILLMIGEERSGLSPGQLSCCDSLVRIPMARNIDSLNVAMAATVLLFEAFSHRNGR